MKSPDQTASSDLCSQDLPVGGDLLARRKSSFSSHPQVAESFAQTTMPSRLHCPPDPESQYCWSSQFPCGDRPDAVSPTEFNWPNFPTSILSYPCPPAYHYHPEPFLDASVSTPSLDGSSQDLSWDCTSSDEMALNTPTSTFSYNVNVQDTDNLEIMMSEGSQVQRPYIEESPRTQSPRIYPQHLLGQRDYRKRHRDNDMLVSGTEDIVYPEKLSRTSFPQMQRTKVEPTPGPEAGAFMEFGEGNGVSTPNGDDTDGEGGVSSEPYAQLIYRALMSAPNHAMVLKDIYEWFEQNTDKAKIAQNSSAKGWQNSIRHNLSMNGAFNKVEQIQPTDDCKRGFIWVLADSALEEGVKSTTRYRKQNSNKKGSRTENPALQRQLSGAKGGKAAKKSAANANKLAASKLRRAARPENISPSSFRDIRKLPQLSAIEEYSGSHQQHQLPYQPDTGPYYHHTPTSTPLLSSSEPRTFDYGGIIGCAPDMEGPLFYDEPMDSPEGPMLSAGAFSHVDEQLLDYHFDGTVRQ